MIAYLDTLAAMKLLVEESESAPLAAYLASSPDRQLVASWLLHVELHCAANRHPDVVDLVAVNVVLEVVSLAGAAASAGLTIARPA